MSKSKLKRKFKCLYDAQEKEVEEAKRKISEKYRPLRETLEKQCAEQGHVYDNGLPAKSGSYCFICNKEII